jgi:hypothetical protein
MSPIRHPVISLSFLFLSRLLWHGVAVGILDSTTLFVSREGKGLWNGYGIRYFLKVTHAIICDGTRISEPMDGWWAGAIPYTGEGGRPFFLFFSFLLSFLFVSLIDASLRAISEGRKASSVELGRREARG